jgi:hypothetical protein
LRGLELEFSLRRSFKADETAARCCFGKPPQTAQTHKAVFFALHGEKKTEKSTHAVWMRAFEIKWRDELSKADHDCGKAIQSHNPRLPAG